MNNPLTKTAIVDKNGVATTRNKRADSGRTQNGERLSGIDAQPARRTETAHNEYGSFTVDSETGFPIVSKDREWRFESRAAGEYYEISLYETQMVERPTLFGKKTKAKKVLLGSAVMHSVAATPERIQRSACGVLKRLDPEYQEKMAHFKKWEEERREKTQPWHDAQMAAAAERRRKEEERNAAHIKKLSGIS